MSVPEQSAQQSAENAHMCIAFVIAHARTRDIAEAKDAAEGAMQHLGQLAKAIPDTSPLFSEMHQLRSIIHSAQQSLARQQQPQDLDKGLDLITALKEHLNPRD